MASFDTTLNLLKNYKDYPFILLNRDINHYILANYYWVTWIKNKFDTDDWYDYGMYLNYDNDSEIGIPVLKLNNYKRKKILTIFHMGIYEEGFVDPFFSVGVGETEVGIGDDKIDIFYELAISIDLRHEKSLSYVLDFIKKFIDENIPLEEMEILIEEFDQKHELELQRK